MTKKEKIEIVIEALEKNSLKEGDLGVLWKLAGVVKKVQDAVKKDQNLSDCFDEVKADRFKEWTNFNKIVKILKDAGYKPEEFCEVLPPSKLEKALAGSDFDLVMDQAIYDEQVRKNLKKEFK